MEAPYIWHDHGRSGVGPCSGAGQAAEVMVRARWSYFQVLPFQCCRIAPFSSAPTAQALRADVAPTPSSWLSGPGVGLGTRVQRAPFQCAIRVLKPVRV